MSARGKKATHKLSDEALEAVAETFRLLSETGRLRLLQELKGGERMVGELVEATGMLQANVSKHLKALYEGGLVTRRKEGVRVFYAVDDEFVFSLCELVCARLDQDQRERREIDFMI